MNIFTRFFSNYFAKPDSPQEIERELIRREAEIGRTVFGPVPKGVKREFFCLDRDTWIWQETANGRMRTTKYKIKKSEIIKSVDGSQYERVHLEEAQRFAEATKTYNDRVKRELYDKLSFA